MYKEVPAGDDGIRNGYFVSMLPFQPGQRDAVNDEHGEVIQDHPCVDLLDDEVTPDAVKAVEGDIVFQETKCCFDPPAQAVELFQGIQGELLPGKIGEQELRAGGEIDLYEPDRDREKRVFIIVWDQVEPAVIEDDFNIWSPLAAMRTASKTEAFFLFFMLQSDLLQRQVWTKLSLGNQPNLGMRALEEFNAVRPCLEEQRLIAAFLFDFDEAIAAAKKELELWKELKKGLLQQMFV